MTRLVVSVRDPFEARQALEAGAHLIDVKEPRRGSLGRAEAGVIAAVASEAERGVPASAALGELGDWPPDEELIPRAILARLAYAKLGLAGCAAWPAWPARLAAVWRTWPPTIGRVAVAYADWQAAEAPPPGDVLEVAAQAGAAAMLIDTAIKSGGTLLDHLPPRELALLVATARRAGLVVVLAGSLAVEHIEPLVRLGPDYLAVRGAVCSTERTGRIDPSRVSEWVERLEAAAA